MTRPQLDAVMPKTIAELKGFGVSVHCPTCGRLAPIDTARLTNARGRALDRGMPLAQFLAKLRCTERACGAHPDLLELTWRVPETLNSHSVPPQRWTMDRDGHWSIVEPNDPAA